MSMQSYEDATNLIRTALKLKSTVNSILVTIVKAQDLLTTKETSGGSDPYVVVLFGDRKIKTISIKKTQSPVWNETLTFSLARRSFAVRTLEYEPAITY